VKLQADMATLAGKKIMEKAELTEGIKMLAALNTPEHIAALRAAVSEIRPPMSWETFLEGARNMHLSCKTHPCIFCKINLEEIAE